MGYRVAVVGATGNVGNEMLQILAERKFPVDEIVALASERSTGKEVSFGDERTLKVQDLAEFDFRGFDIALFSPGAKVSAEHAPRAAAAGCVVIDNTSHFRMDPDVPLVVPEVNRGALAGFHKKNIVANPNCSTIQMVVALKPLHDIARIKRVVVVDLPVGQRRRPRSHGRAVRAHQGDLHERSQGARVLQEADPLQRHSPGRRLPRGRGHQGGVEDGGRDQEDPRPQDPRRRHLRARAGVRRPCRGGQRRVRGPARPGRGARGAARGRGRGGGRRPTASS